MDRAVCKAIVTYPTAVLKHSVTSVLDGIVREER
jgi:hypothetical protein